MNLINSKFPILCDANPKDITIPYNSTVLGSLPGGRNIGVQLY